MKTIKKATTAVVFALIAAAMYHCFLHGVPAQGKARMVYIAGTGIFCIFLWTMAVGAAWYVKWLQKQRQEYKEMYEKILDTLSKSTDELDK